LICGRRAASKEVTARALQAGEGRERDFECCAGHRKGADFGEERPSRALYFGQALNPGQERMDADIPESNGMACGCEWFK